MGALRGFLFAAILAGVTSGTANCAEQGVPADDARRIERLDALVFGLWCAAPVMKAVAFGEAIQGGDSDSAAVALNWLDQLEWSPAEQKEFADLAWERFGKTPDAVWAWASLQFLPSEELPQQLERGNAIAGSGGLAGSREVLRRFWEKYLECSLTGGNYEPVVKKLELLYQRDSAAEMWRLELALAAVDFLRTAQLRYAVKGRICESVERLLPRLERFLLAHGHRLPEAPIEFFSDLIWRYARNNPESGAEVERLTGKFPAPTCDKLRLELVVRSGNMARLEEFLRDHDYAPVFAEWLRFRTLSESGDFAAAEKQLDKVAAQEAVQGAAAWGMAMRRQDWAELSKQANALADRGGDAVLPLLISAEKYGRPADLHRAEALAGEAADRDPEMANAFGYVAVVLGVDGDKAERRLKFALSRQPHSSAVLDSMAWLEFKRGKLDEAEKYILRSLEQVNPDSGIGVILEHAGDIAAARGKTAEAELFYRRSLRLGKDDPGFEPEAVEKKLELLKQP